MKVLRLVSRRTKVFKSQKHVDVMFALNLFEHMRMQVGEMCLNHRHPPPPPHPCQGSCTSIPCPPPQPSPAHTTMHVPPLRDVVQLPTRFDSKLTLSRADTRLLELGRMVVGVEPSPMHSVTIAALCRFVPVGGLNPAAPGLLTRNERLQFLRVCACPSTLFPLLRIPSPHSPIGSECQLYDTAPPALMSPCELYAAASRRGRHGPRRPPCDGGPQYVPLGQHNLGEN